MNLTSSNLCLRLQFSTADAHPYPVSPNPWMKMTVAVCLAAAGNNSGGARRIAIVGSEFVLANVAVKRNNNNTMNERINVFAIGKVSIR